MQAQGLVTLYTVPAEPARTAVHDNVMALTCLCNTYIHVFIINPEGSMIHQYYKISLKTQIQFRITRYHLKRNLVHNRDATLARHIERLDAIATSCDSATPWQSLNRLPVGYITESDTSANSARRTILSAGMRSTCPR